MNNDNLNPNVYTKNEVKAIKLTFLCNFLNT